VSIAIALLAQARHVRLPCGQRHAHAPRSIVLLPHGLSHHARRSIVTRLFVERTLGALCAPGASSGKMLFLGSFGTPDASARFGARQGTLGPAPVHFGRVQRSVGPGEDVLLGGSPAKKKRERKERKDADG